MTILYTYQLNGNLAYLPRLFTYLREISAQLPTKPLLLDLGGSCTPDVWHCDVTEGRSTLIVLDAMGYHAVNYASLLTPASYAKVKDQVAMALVADEPQQVKNTYLATQPAPLSDEHLKICLTPSHITHWNMGWLHLGKIASDELGIVQLDGDTIQHQVIQIPPNTAPNPTISGVVDFVLAEANLYRKKK
ncbi:MAG: hypothetical protein MUE54_04380 [Anaerolineae bacterium]|nr:hypothetical protein [Anaerolineae bacterium]